MRFLKLTSLKLLVHDCRHLISPSLFLSSPNGSTCLSGLEEGEDQRVEEQK